jgi:hypothetical protein
MQRTQLAGMLVLLAASFLFAQDGEKLKSGPPVGALMPKPFACVNVNGPDPLLKGRPNCLVCKFALNPSVVIFARELAEGKDETFNDLLAKLDEVCADFDERSFAVGVVILSPSARDSTNNGSLNASKAEFEKAVEAIAPGLQKASALHVEAARVAARDKTALEDAQRIADRDKTAASAALVKERKEKFENSEKDAAKCKEDLDKVLGDLPPGKLKEVTEKYVAFSKELNEESKKRKKLIDDLEKRTDKLKHVVVSVHPDDGPAGYDLNPKAEITLLFYERMKVIQNYAFAPGALEAKDVDSIVARIRKELPFKKKVSGDK